MAEQRGLSDGDVQQRLLRLDELLERIEAVPSPATEMAVEALEALTEVYGTALARIVALLEPDGTALRALCADELVEHLLVLHGLHPDPAEQRIARALDEVQPHLAGAEVALTGIEDGVARVQVEVSGCQSSAGAVADAIGDVVLAAAPELVGVQPVTVRPRAAPALIPVESLLRRPVSS